MACMLWTYDPHSGGGKITPSNQSLLLKQADAFSRTRPWFPRFQLKLRFKGQFCYVDSIEEGSATQFPLCRLRYLRDNMWSMGFFTYSNDRYEPCVFQSGKMEGSIEEAIASCEIHLV